MQDKMQFSVIHSKYISALFGVVNEVVGGIVVPMWKSTRQCSRTSVHIRRSRYVLNMYTKLHIEIVAPNLYVGSCKVCSNSNSNLAFPMCNLMFDPKNLITYFRTVFARIYLNQGMFYNMFELHKVKCNQLHLIKKQAKQRFSLSLLF